MKDMLASLPQLREVKEKVRSAAELLPCFARLTCLAQLAALAPPHNG